MDRIGLAILEPRAEKGDSHHLPVAAGDTAPAKGRGLQTNGGCHLFPHRDMTAAQAAGTPSEPVAIQFP